MILLAMPLAGGVAMLCEAVCLGSFGDERLEKRGPGFWAGWLGARASAFAVWRAARVVASLALAGSCPIPR